jgi:hypothetical protein
MLSEKGRYLQAHIFAACGPHAQNIFFAWKEKHR